MEHKTVTTNSKTWDELIKAHPCRVFGKMMGKLFPFYDLAHQVFSGTFETGELAAKEMPNLSISPATINSPPTSAVHKKQKQKKVASSIFKQ